MRQKPHATEWIICGSSPGVHDALALARRVAPRAKVAASNAAIALVGVPDLLWMSDQVACEMFGDDARKAYDAGCWCMSMSRTKWGREYRGIEWFDEFTELDGPGATWFFQKGRYTRVNLSGLYLMQAAINHGAQTLHVVGCEGYRGGLDYFDGRTTKPTYGVKTPEVVEPQTQALIDATPDVLWTFYGDLAYTPKGDNVEVIRVRQEAIRRDPFIRPAPQGGNRYAG